MNRYTWHHKTVLPGTIRSVISNHSKTKAKSPQTNGICERFHRTIQDEFYAIAFRKKIYNSLDELQKDLDGWLHRYNNERTHSGKHCFGKTPMRTLLDSKHLADEKMLDLHYEKVVSLPVPEEVETGSGGDQPVRNIPADRNEQGAIKSPLPYNHFGNNIP